MKLEDYLKNEVRDGSLHSYSYVLTNFRDWLGGNKLDEGEYDSNEVREFIDDLGEEKDWKPRSKNTALGIIKSLAKYQIDNINQAFDKPSIRNYDNPSQDKMMQIMMEREEVEDEMEKTADRLRKVRNMGRFTVEGRASLEGNSLTLRQLGELLHKTDRIDRPIHILYSFFGCRKMELPTYHNLDLENNSIDFVSLKGRTKVGKRRLFFPDYVGKIFRANKEGKLRLKYSEDGYYKKVNRYKDKMGLEKLNPTTFRHTFRTLMDDQPVDKKTIRYMMAHKQKDVTDSAYFDQNERKIKRAMTDNHYHSRLDLPDKLY